MNIHFNPTTGQRISTPEARRLSLPIRSSEGTKAPRSRDNIGNVPSGASQSMGSRINASKVYPGGKHLRRARANLLTRQMGEQGPGHHQPDSHKGSQSNWATKPGSMKRG